MLFILIFLVILDNSDQGFFVLGREDMLKKYTRYEIEEGWRADLFNGINDDRVNLAWGANVWFWAGTQYLKAYTEYTIKDATDRSLLGTKREWEKDIRSLYEAAPRK